MIVKIILIIIFLLLPTNVEASQKYKNKKISWYDCGQRKFCKTANGEWFQKDTAACHTSYKFGTMFLISYNGNSVRVVCRDRGAFENNGSNVFLDISRTAFNSLANIRRGIIYADVTILNGK